MKKRRVAIARSRRANGQRRRNGKNGARANGAAEVIQPLRGLGQEVDRAIQRDAPRLAAVVQSSHDAIVAKNLSGIVTDWNQSAERIFGYKAKEIIGKSILTVIPKDRHDEEKGILRKIRRGELIEHYETVRRRKDGRLVDVALTISPIKDFSGKIIGASKIARDISRQKKAERLMGEQARLLNLSDEAIKVLRAAGADVVTGSLTDWTVASVHGLFDRITR